MLSLRSRAIAGVLLTAAICACGGSASRDLNGAEPESTDAAAPAAAGAGGRPVAEGGAGGVAGSPGGAGSDCIQLADPLSGTLIWARRAGGPGVDVASDVAVDPEGRLVVVGGYSEAATFGAGEPNETTVEALGAGDGFVARYAPDGNFETVRQMGGTSAQSGDAVNHVAFTAGGSMLMAGKFSDVVVFGAGEPDGVELRTVAGWDAFVVSYDARGAVEWVTHAGGEGADWIDAMAVTDDAVTVAAALDADVTLGIGNADGETPLTLQGGDRDVYVARYGLDGALQWAKSAGSPLTDTARAAAACADGTSFVAGSTYSDMVFDPGLPTELGLTSNGWLDLFLARYDRDGHLAWAKQIGGNDSDEAYAIATLPDCSLLVTGYFSETAVFGAGEPNETRVTSSDLHDTFLARYSVGGQLIWFRHIAGRAIGTALAATPDGSVFMGGWFADDVTFAPGECNQVEISTAADDGIFVARYTDTGDLLWVREIDGTGYDSIRSIVPHPDGTVLLAGTMEQNLVLGRGEPNETTLASAGQGDAFIARFWQ